MRSMLKPLFAALAVIGSPATRVQAEQFDTTYSDDGRFSEEVPGLNRRALAMLETPSGEILQVSWVNGGCTGSAVCPRFTYLTADGVRFISYGPALSSTAGFASVAGAAIDSHGRIIIAGSSPPTVGGSNFRVMRFLPNGDLDPSFAGDGGTDVDFGLDDYATAVAVDANDNVIVVGQVGISPTDTDFGVARLRGSDGTPDTTFSSDGKTTAFFDLGSASKFDVAKAVAIAPDDGRIALVGIAFDSAINRYRVALARLNGDGSPDTSFCNPGCNYQGSYTGIHTGRRVYYFGDATAHSDIAAGVAVAGSGDLFIVGETYASDGSNKRAAVTHFTAAGDYVAETLNDGLSNNAAYRSVQLSDADAQRVLVAGDSGPGSNFLLLQAFSYGLSPLANYGNCLGNTAFCFVGGTGLGDYGPDQAASITLDRRGRVLFAGSYLASDGEFDQSLFARFTNDTGPRPDLIFRNGFQ